MVSETGSASRYLIGLGLGGFGVWNPNVCVRAEGGILLTLVALGSGGRAERPWKLPRGPAPLRPRQKIKPVGRPGERKVGKVGKVEKLRRQKVVGTFCRGTPKRNANPPVPPVIQGEFSCARLYLCYLEDL